MSSRWAIIVAGGSGKRMESKSPKQFLEIDGRPILMHTLETINRTDNTISIILVLPQDHLSSWDALVTRHQFTLPHQITVGGSTRFHSVQNGLRLLPEEGLVAIHDGVRPFVSSEMIKDSYLLAERAGSAVAAVPLKESLRKLTENGRNQSEDRSKYVSVQTPQTFQIKRIKDAFENSRHADFTDDASVYENAGGQIHLYDGEYTNRKITTPDDLLWAQHFLSTAQNEKSKG